MRTPSCDRLVTCRRRPNKAPSRDERLCAQGRRDLLGGLIHEYYGRRGVIESGFLIPTGCGGRVVTPLSPDDWRLTYDGDTVSLWPSIGNWAFACQSHYWIRSDQIVWAPK